jgi:hypothetical protein
MASAFWADIKPRFLGRWGKSSLGLRLDGMPGAALVMDAHGAVLAANEAAEQIVHALQEGALPDQRADIAVAASRNMGTLTEIILPDEEARGAYDV